MESSRVYQPLIIFGLTYFNHKSPLVKSDLHPVAPSIIGGVVILLVLFLTAGSVYLRPAADAAPRHVPVRFQARLDDFTTDQSTTGYELAVTGSGLTILPEGSDIPWRHEFLNRNRRSTGIRHGEEVLYQEIFTGVNLRLYDKGIGRAGYDFIVRPGQSAARILMQLDGPGTAYLDELTEELVLPVTGGKQIRHTRPVAYQQLAGERLAVAAGFTLTPGGLLGFEVGDYNPDYALVIDPAIVLAEAANITDNNQADPIKLSRCFTPNQLEVNVQFLVDGEPTISYIMPEGIFYIPGSVNIGLQTSSAGTVFSVVEEDVSDPRAPVFTLDQEVGIGDFIRLQLDLRANCDAATGSDDIEVTVVTGNDESFGLVLANVLEADLSVLSHEAQTIMINESRAVEITIRNGGLGQLDSFLFVIDTTEISATTVSVTADNGNIVLQPVRVGASVQYEIPPEALMTIGNGDGVFDNTEAIVLTRTVIQESCRPTEQIFRYTDFYRAIFGCPGSCQVPEPTAPGAFSVPNVFVTLAAEATLIQQSDYCQPTITEVTVTNTSSPTDQLQSAFNLEFINTIGDGIEAYTVGDLDVASIELVTDNGLLPLVYTGGDNQPGRGSFSQLTTPQPGSGLVDLDGDGQFDDLGLNQSFTLRYTYTYTRAACNLNDERGNDFYLFPYSDDCGRDELFVELRNASFNYSNTFEITGIEAAATVENGEPFTVNICEVGGPQGSWLQNGQLSSCPDRNTLLSVQIPLGLIALPGAGYTVSADGGTITSSQPFTDSGQNCFLLNLNSDCSQLPGDEASYQVFLPYEFSNDCNSSGGCATQLERCDERLIRVNCAAGGGDCGFAPCANQPLLTSTSVFRTTLGFTDPAFGINDRGRQFTDISQIPAANRTRGTACDSIAITGTIGQCGDPAVSTDNVFLRIAIDRFANRPNQATLEEGTRGVFTLTRADGTTEFEDLPLPSPQSVNVEGRDFIIYDLSALLPEGELRGGDIIDFRTDHRLSLAVDAQSQNLQELPGFSISSFSLPSASDRVVPNSKTERFACIERTLAFNVHSAKVSTRQQRNTYRFFGCREQTFLTGLDLRTGGSTRQDYYPNELRPFYVIDSLTISFRNLYKGGVGTFSTAANSPGYRKVYSLDFSPSVSMNPSDVNFLPGKLIQGAPEWTFRYYNTNRTYLALAEYRDFGNRGNNAYELRLTGGLLCSATRFSYDSYVDGQRYAHNNPEPGCFTERRQIDLYGVSSRPRLNLVNRSGTQVLDEARECFDVDIVKPGNQQVRAISLVSDYLNPARASDLRIISIKNRDNGSPYELLDYEEGQWAKIVGNLNSSRTETVRLEVCLEAGSCSATDQLPLFVGLSCTGLTRTHPWR